MDGRRDNSSSEAKTRAALSASSDAEKAKQRRHRDYVNQSIETILSIIETDKINNHLHYPNLLVLVDQYISLADIDQKLGKRPLFNRANLQLIKDYLTHVEFFIFNTPGITEGMKVSLGKAAFLLTKNLMDLYEDNVKMTTEKIQELNNNVRTFIDSFVQQGNEIISQAEAQFRADIQDRWNYCRILSEALAAALITGVLVAVVGLFIGAGVGVVVGAAAAPAIGAGVGGMLGALIGIVARIKVNMQMINNASNEEKIHDENKLILERDMKAIGEEGSTLIQTLKIGS